jgi:hypothetical protein
MASPRALDCGGGRPLGSSSIGSPSIGSPVHMMDLQKLIDELHFQKTRLDHAIAELEQLQADRGGSRDVVPLKRRGRKSMGLKERKQVSERMKTYWATKSDLQQAIASGKSDRNDSRSSKRTTIEVQEISRSAGRAKAT